MSKSNQPLTEAEKKQLIFSLQELEDRGVPVPAHYKDVYRPKQYVWPVDSNGYFISRNGTFFTPYEEQEGFINSNAVLVLFRSGRGGGKTASGAQKALKKIEQLRAEGKWD